jgi:hypothetical protein
MVIGRCFKLNLKFVVFVLLGRFDEIYDFFTDQTQVFVVPEIVFLGMDKGMVEPFLK